MLFLDLTLPTPQENLALDEALLTTAETSGGLESLRVWQSPTQLVVLGKNCRAAEDVWLDRCAADGVAVLRRPSGGGTVLIGPGCLNFSLVLRYDRSPDLAGVQSSFRYVLDRVQRAIERFEPDIVLAGESDLVVHDRKISGNAQRRLRSHLLHQGSLLLDGFDLPAVARYLREPVRQPTYRVRRNHAEFLTCLRVPAEPIRVGLRMAWGNPQDADGWPRAEVTRLVTQTYSRPGWNLRM